MSILNDLGSFTIMAWIISGYAAAIFTLPYVLRKELREEGFLFAWFFFYFLHFLIKALYHLLWLELSLALWTGVWYMFSMLLFLLLVSIVLIATPRDSSEYENVLDLGGGSVARQVQTAMRKELDRDRRLRKRR